MQSSSHTRYNSLMLKKLSLFLPYLVFLSLPLVAFTKGKGTVILLIALCLGIWVSSRSIPSLSHKIKEYKHPLCWAVVFLLWCGLSILWSQGPMGEIFLRYGRLIGLISMSVLGYACLVHATSETQSHFHKAFIVGYSVYLVFYVLVILTHNFGLQYDQNKFLRGVVILSLLVWPYMGTLRKKIVQVSLLAGFLWLIYGVSPDAAFFAMALSGVVYFSPLLLQKCILFSMLLGGVAMPWISKYLLNESLLFDYMRFIPTSHQHRIFMWEELSKWILKNPLWGYGFDFSAFIKSPALLCNHYSTEVMQTRFKDLTPLLTYEGGGKICDGQLTLGIHPHNGFLQIWLELGGIGMLLFSLLAIMLYRSIQHNKLAVAMLTFYGVIFSISFSVWQNWMIATLWLGFMCLFVVNHRHKDHI